MPCVEKIGQSVRVGESGSLLHAAEALYRGNCVVLAAKRCNPGMTVRLSKWGLPGGELSKRDAILFGKALYDAGCDLLAAQAAVPDATDQPEGA